MSNESLYPDDWITIAEKDHARVNRLLQDKDSEAAGFYLQQTVEKYLKAFLLSHGWSLRRVHDLETLLDDALVYDNGLAVYRQACITITAFYFIDRYPLLIGAPVSETDVRANLAAIQGLIDAIRKVLGKP